MIKTVKQIINNYRERRFRMWCLRMYLRACGNHYGAKMPVIYQYVKEGKNRRERRYRKKCIEIAAGISYGPRSLILVTILSKFSITCLGDK